MPWVVGMAGEDLGKELLWDIDLRSLHNHLLIGMYLGWFLWKVTGHQGSHKEAALGLKHLRTRTLPGYLPSAMMVSGRGIHTWCWGSQNFACGKNLHPLLPTGHCRPH